MKLLTTPHQYERLKFFLSMHDNFDVFVDNNFDLNINNDKIDPIYDHHRYMGGILEDPVISFSQSVVDLYRLQFSRFCDLMDVDEYDRTRSDQNSFGFMIDRFYFTNTFIQKFAEMISEMYKTGDLSNDTHESSFMVDYLEQYGKGFFKGFNSFMDEYLLKILDGFTDKDSKRNKIFEFATFKWNEFQQPISDFSFKHNIYVPVISSAFKTGIHYGMIYRAWSNILMNQKDYEPLAESYLKDLNSNSICLGDSDEDEFWEIYLDAFPEGYAEFGKNEIETNTEDVSSPFSNDVLDEDKSFKPSKKVKSMDWINLKKDSSLLDDIHKSLLQDGYIDCKLKDFKKVFSNTTDYSRIQWFGRDVQLIYFQELLENKKLIKLPYNRWQQLRSCFKYDSKNERSILNQVNNDSIRIYQKEYFDNLVK